jgi:hypothetical protein
MRIRLTRAGRAGTVVAACLLGAGVLIATPVSAANPRTVAKSSHVAPKVFTPVSGYTVKNPPTAAQVNTAVVDGVDYIDCQQDQTTGDPNIGSFNADVPETAAAIIGYAVLSRGDISNLPTAIDDPSCPGADRDFQTDLTKALAWMLGQQDKSAPSLMGIGGSWTYEGEFYTYSTGLALSALGLITSIPSLKTQIANAITLGRAFLADDQQIEPDPSVSGQKNCTTTPNSPTGEDSSYYCGGWNYYPTSVSDELRSDESNTGYAITGLHLTGGLTAQEKAYNIGWQNNDQADSTTNHYWAGGGNGDAVHNDGGGSYEPVIVSDIPNDDFSSNANDSGSLLFGYADDGVTISDPRVDKALQFDTDVLDTYEKTANEDPNETGSHTMVYHNAAQADGSCAVGTTTGGVPCDWDLGTGEGGFHYSLFTLSKGFGSYIPADLSDGSNWYAKIADLLVHQQVTTPACTAEQDVPCLFGSWPADLRDDFSTLFSTGLSIFALGLVATPPPPVTTVTTSAACNGIVFNWTNPTTENYGGLFIQRSTTGFPATAADGTRVADVERPGTSFTDTGVVSGTTYYYALFSHDTSGEEAVNGVDVKATPTPCEGYRMEGGDGGIFDFRQAYHGSVGFPKPPGLGLKIYNFVGMAPTATGYWLVQSNGGIFTFGGAHFYGSLPNSGKKVNDVVGIAATPGGGGYWIVGSNGTVYPYGNAADLGSLSGVSDIIAIVSPDAGGYWLIARDGGVFSFGDAHYHGSCPATGSGCKGVDDVVGAARPDAGGYWLVGRDGGVFGFGDAHYHGGCPGSGLSCRGTTSVVGIANPDAGGYWIAQSDGAIDTFGDAKFFGACAQTGSGCQGLVRPIVAIT